MPIIYVPILKWKKGEQEALRNLETNRKELITPLIEVVDFVEVVKLLMT